MHEPQFIESLPEETPLERAHREFLTGCPFCERSWKLHFTGRGVYVDCGGEEEA